MLYVLEILRKRLNTEQIDDKYVLSFNFTDFTDVAALMENFLNRK